jgi:hypothetical protein
MLLNKMYKTVFLCCRLGETERTRHFLLLREKLGIDRPLVITAAKEHLDKSEKEAVNLVARASGEGRAMVRPGRSEQQLQAWDMTAKEREIATKFVKLIQYHPNKVAGGGGVTAAAEGETPTAGDPDRLLADAVTNSSQHE